MPPRSLWPIHHLLLTADTPSGRPLFLHPREQLSFLEAMKTLCGETTFATSLVYSTPCGNTGWTAFTMAPECHVTYHHWDEAAPGLLQLDVVSQSELDYSPLEDVRSFWRADGYRLYKIVRDRPERRIEPQCVHDTLLQRKRGERGLGPGCHVHAILDATGRADIPLSGTELDRQLSSLVRAIGMRGLTPPMSSARAGTEEFTYDGVMGITTSHVLLRLRQTATDVEISLETFSCREFDLHVLDKWVAGLINVGQSRWTVYNRHPEGSIVVR